MSSPGDEFEDEVRRVARELWPTAEFGGAANAEHQERDGIFKTEWITHLLECTVSRGKDKARQDIEKLVKLRKKYMSRGEPVMCWFVTQSEPTADQRAVAPKDGSVRVLSFDQFRANLVDASMYVRDRERYPFGSARDPSSGGVVVREEYISVPLIGSSASDSQNVQEVSDGIRRQGRYVLLGDYGTGKSMTLREIFRNLARSSPTESRFPIHINLRDHHGQREPAEALDRHARLLGYPHPYQLVRAWRAGYVHILLDGFDEMGTPGWSASTFAMKDVRHRSVELVRRFVSESSPSSGVIIAGREHFFDSAAEMRVALGVPVNTVILRLGEFSDEDINRYLGLQGWHQGLPAWMPARPLLLSYLAHKNLLVEAMKVPAGSAPAAAWDALLALICNREAHIEANIDGETLRRVVERVASIAREKPDAYGPVTFEEIARAFAAVSSFEADDRSVVLLQRLPGLGPADEERGSRRFIDVDFADVACAGDLVEFASHPYDRSRQLPQWSMQLGQLGVESAALRLANRGLVGSHLSNAARVAAESEKGDSFLTDIARVIHEGGGRLASDRPFAASGVLLQDLRLDEARANLSTLEIYDSVINFLDLPRDGVPDENLPTFIRCIVGTVEGRSSHRDLPVENFRECEFGVFSEIPETTEQILKTTLPPGTRVVLTIVRKLYAQKGRGRKEGALYRGLDLKDRELVPAALEILEKEGLALKSKAGAQTIWLPMRSETKRAFGLLEAPTGVEDPVLGAASLL